MNAAALLFVAVIACASAAVPASVEIRNDAVAMDSRNARFVDGIVASAVESASQNIREAGLDPFVMEKLDFDYQLPVPNLFNGAASAENVQVFGASNIVINRMDFALLTTRLRFDISLPQIVASVDNAWFDFTVLGHKVAGRTTSRLDVINLGLTGDIRLNVGVISGVSVRDITLNFYCGDLQYNGFANFLGYDITPLINELVYHYIPVTVNGVSAEINELLEIIVTQVISDFL